jgi:hypothetical protein
MPRSSLREPGLDNPNWFGNQLLSFIGQHPNWTERPFIASPLGLLECLHVGKL